MFANRLSLFVGILFLTEYSTVLGQIKLNLSLKNTVLALPPRFLKLNSNNYKLEYYK
jgi:hypothetical protein